MFQFCVNHVVCRVGLSEPRLRWIEKENVSVDTYGLYWTVMLFLFVHLNWLHLNDHRCEVVCCRILCMWWYSLYTTGNCSLILHVTKSITIFVFLAIQSIGNEQTIPTKHQLKNINNYQQYTILIIPNCDSLETI